MAPNRIIIDTDPGIDDVLALLLAFSAPSSLLEVVLISVTFGNVEARSCLRNAVAVFETLDRELRWRRNRGEPEGFEGITKHKPVLAVGADEPLHEQLLMADYFHGRDGLAGIHESHPHLSPEDTWQKLFEQPPPNTLPSAVEGDAKSASDGPSFVPSLVPAHREILRVLRENEPDTITIVAIGPLTNLALAAAEDTETFLRVKEVVSMGGAIDLHGNGKEFVTNRKSQVSPVSEFNVFADSIAAARIYALTSADPSSTMPPTPPHVEPGSALPAYPTPLSRPLNLILFPVDLTESHTISRATFERFTQPMLLPHSSPPSPLTTWMTAFMQPMFAKMDRLHQHNPSSDDNNNNRNTKPPRLQLHDPVCIGYVLNSDSDMWIRNPCGPEDIRVETTGQWTRGMTVVDRRTRKRRDSDGGRPHDLDNWLGSKGGNRVVRMVGGPRNDEDFGRFLLEKLFWVRGWESPSFEVRRQQEG